MDADLGLRLIVAPTLAWLATLGIRSDARAEVMLLAIAGQESGFRARAQNVAGGGKGPARGLWQFERGGGVAGVLAHPSSAKTAAAICSALLVPADAASVHAALEQNDALACAFARLLLWTDARALPDCQYAGWAYYLRNWRPGKPHPETWPANWQAAHQALEVA
jgi:hypothetical protein